MGLKFLSNRAVPALKRRAILSQRSRTQKVAARSNSRRLSQSNHLLGHSQRGKRRLVNRRGRVQIVVTLIISQRRARERSKQTIHFPLIISLVLQRRLNVGDHLVWWQVVVSID